MIELKETFNASVSELYEAWLDSDKHSAMTGAEAVCGKLIGDNFTAWDEYISGHNKALKPNEEIVQAWRTTEFNDSDPNSLLTIRFKEVDGGTEVTLIHENIAEDEPNYEQGWLEYYFEPMKAFFG